MKIGFETYSGSGRSPVAIVALAMLALLVAGYAQTCRAGQPGQATFPSAEEASRALFLAVENHDERAVTGILGAKHELISSDDEVEDKLDRERFVQKYQEMHRLVKEPGGGLVLYIGAENWPFPIPLVSRNGAWRFDSDAGLKEVLFRWIGENEVTAVQVCHAFIARKQHPGANDQTDDSIGAMLADAGNNNGPLRFHGYYFRILTNQGKNAPAGATGQLATGGMTERSAFIAYPAAYRSSGVMTFIVDQDDVVYEKDLGPRTAKLAGAMTVYRPDPTWRPAETAP
jgi:Protein of unknown function (DUF2950)